MAQQAPLIGHPCKYAGGWDSENKRIFILKSTYEQWGQVKRLKELHNDNAVTQYLLSCHEIVSARQHELIQKEHSEESLSCDARCFEDESSCGRLRLIPLVGQSYT